MTTPTGTITLQDVQDEFGGAHGIGLNEYYDLASGIPASGAISMDDLRGKQFLVSETLTSSQTWTPKPNLASYIHIFCFGAGGSGGSAEPDTSSGFLNPAGNCSASGGGAGGYSYSKIAASAAGSSTVVIGVGGAGVQSPYNHYQFGNDGTATTFTGSGLTMSCAGGQGGRASETSNTGTDYNFSAGALGGAGSGGNVLNKNGGDSGSSVSDNAGTEASSSSGGGCPVIDDTHAGSSGNTGNSQTSEGAKVSDNGTWPTYLSTYQLGRAQSALLSAANTTLDGTEGSRLSDSLDATYGAGSGGASRGTHTSGRGGNGLVFIVYEI